MNPATDARIFNALERACEKAEAFRGATAPNPPVGSAALNAKGEILSVQAHKKAGTPHAEALLIQDLRERHLMEHVHAVVVTLEPCNHYGRTPPCAESLLTLPFLRQVHYAVSDPNPKAQGGSLRLQQAGIDVRNLGLTHPDSPQVQRAIELSRPFIHWLKTRRPWVTVKTAWMKKPDGTLTMIPPLGQKTFTSASSLILAHQLRKRSDAILTGSGTVLADWPELTVRHVSDHSEKRRWLIVLDRRKRIPEEWLQMKQSQGFQVRRAEAFSNALDLLGAQGALEVLIEAGPTLSRSILDSQLWNEQISITANPDGEDLVERKFAISDERKLANADRHEHKTMNEPTLFGET